MINCFEREYAFLSNFYPSPIEYEGIKYPTVEAAFQAAKTPDMHMKVAIATAEHPGKAKRMGRKVVLREDWEEIKDKVMEDCLKLKFSDPIMREKLLATGDEELEEGNWWHDNYWGSCYCSRCGDVGKNKLGYLLMKIRKEI